MIKILSWNGISFLNDYTTQDNKSTPHTLDIFSTYKTGYKLLYHFFRRILLLLLWPQEVNGTEESLQYKHADGKEMPDE